MATGGQYTFSLTDGEIVNVLGQIYVSVLFYPDLSYSEAGAGRCAAETQLGQHSQTQLEGKDTFLFEKTNKQTNKLFIENIKVPWLGDVSGPWL